MSQKHTISSKQILAGDTEQLQLLLRFLDVDSGRKRDRQDNGGKAMSAEQLQDVLDTLQQSDLDEQQSLFNAIEWAGGDQQLTLSDDQYCWISFLEDLYRRLLQNAQLDASMFSLLMQLRVCFVKQVFMHSSLLSEQQHPFRQLLERILTAAVSWNQTLGKSGEAFFSQTTDIVSHLCSSAVWSMEFIVELQQQWLTATDREQQRVSRLEKRLYDTESGQIRARRAQQLVLEMINSRLAGRRVPAVFAQFCLGSWKDELRLFLIRHGVNNEEWQRGQKLLENLAKSFQLPTSDEERQRLYSIIPRLGNELVRHVSEVAEQPDKYQTIIETIEGAHIQILKGLSLDCVEIEPQAIPDAVAGVTMYVSEDLRKKVMTLDEGQWLRYREEQGQELRCKLLAKIPDTDQLLFVNRNGLKVLQKGIDDLAYCLSAGIAVPLPLSSHCSVERAYQDLVKTILSDYELRQNEIRELQTQRAEQSRQRTLQEADRLKAQLREQEVKAAAAAKAKAEAQALAQAREVARREAQEAALQQEQIVQQQAAEREQEQKDQELARFTRLSLDSLSIGAWVEIPNRDGVKTTCKLAVKVNSSRKFIFVDRNGVKVGELIRDELVTLILAGEAKIIDQGDHFEERLAKVVSSLRRDKSQ